MLNIELFTEGEAEFPFHGIRGDDITAVAEKAARFMELDNAVITFIISDNNYIRAINRDYRRKDSPTDVISFAYREDPFPGVEDVPEELGDIYISIERAQEQALEYGVDLIDELKRLIVHGILHLVGYDHEMSPEDEAVMRAKEEEILNTL
ncbi:MAG TPA: rRNA maturation RNase YbeY [Spirochaetota bacterium]|nr:rRNA maturation RNase YbeY [Spirochaetota bacterium]HQP49464.1 rRNA maturation RNase YbeY [Spirochaetota bacterium]